jgi:hypothetical protein
MKISYHSKWIENKGATLPFDSELFHTILKAVVFLKKNSRRASAFNYF